MEKPDFEVPPEEPIPVSFTGSKVVVWDSQNGSRLFRFGYYGKPVGIRKPKSSYVDRPFELTLLESLYLAENNHIQVNQHGKILTSSDFRREIAKVRFHLFDDLYLVYKDLRDNRYIVRPGLKFGSDFSVYRQGPGVDHAMFLIRVIPRGALLHPLDLVSAGRLANSVKKRFILATVISETQIRYYEFKWTKP